MTSGTVAVIDYGLCNIDSITRALEELGAQVDKTRDPRVVDRADRIVLPGVGAYGAAMENLRKWGLVESIQARIEAGTPFLGICLGMQLMATRSDEFGSHMGLGIVPGTVIRLEARNADERVPHIGWNEVVPTPGMLLFEGIAPASDFFFVHSFHLQVGEMANEAARTPYCGGFTSAVSLPGRPVFGTQFHPEKSQRNGRRLLRNFLAV